jgi:thiamine biosynthesis lipoprotein
VVRQQYEIEVWGTVLSISAISTTLDKGSIDGAIEDVKSFVYEVDEVFSTYKSESVISKLRRGEIEIGSCSDDVIEVWNACGFASEISDGAFNPWAVAGGFDPSGYVKGWAADRVAEILVNVGVEHVQVNAAGDLTLRGGFLTKEGVIQPWKIGVVSPDIRQEVLRVFEIHDGAIATSGTYERGAHILDPNSGTIAIGAKSATVIGPDGGLSDALATALMVSGDDGAQFFGRAELAEYSAWVIDRHSGGAWAVGPIFAGDTTLE